jgi:hypothetical protein
MESVISKVSPYYTVDKGENANPGAKGYGPSDQGLKLSFPGSPIIGDMKVLSRDEREVTMPQLLIKGHVKNAGPNGTCDPEIEGEIDFDVTTEESVVGAYGPTPGFLIGAGVPPVGSDGTNIFNREYFKNLHPEGATFHSTILTNVSDAPHVHGPNINSPESIGSLIKNFHLQKPMSTQMAKGLTENMIKKCPNFSGFAPTSPLAGTHNEAMDSVIDQVAKSSYIMDQSAGEWILGFSSQTHADNSAAKPVPTPPAP